MASIKFEVLSNSQTAPIYLRLSVKRNVTPRAKTGLYIDSKEWSRETKLPKQTKSVNKNLTTDLLKLKVFILEKLNKSIIENNNINKLWLEHKIDVFFKRVDESKNEVLVVKWIKHIIENSHTMPNQKKQKGLSKNRIKSYKSLLVRFQKYQEYKKGKNYNIIDIDKKFFLNFETWLLTIEKYSASTSTKFLTDLQKVVRVASNEIEISKDFNSIKFQKVETYDDDMDVITLTENEIERIHNLDLQKEALINARKWLILSIFTGQRGTTLVERINQKNFHPFGNEYKIELKQIKGNKKVYIPVLPPVKKIFEEGLPYKISTQKLNQYIKTICKLAEINEMVMGNKRNKETNRNEKKLRPKYKYISTHTGRRTFATIHYNKIPTPIIMRVTGHKKESTFLQYINQNNDDHLDTFIDYYKTKELKQRKEPILKVVNDKF
jgi:integrase